ncbi:hypothetical protein BKA93DRAFT_824614 [Sparassis latifolia]
MSLLTINDDVLLLIISLLRPYDALSLSETSRHFHAIALPRALSSVTLINHRQLTAFCTYMLSGSSAHMLSFKSLSVILGDGNFTNAHLLADVLEHARSLRSIGMYYSESLIQLEPRIGDALAALEGIDEVKLHRVGDALYGMLSKFRSKPRKVSLTGDHFPLRLSHLPLQNAEHLEISWAIIEDDTPSGGCYAGPQWLACRHLALNFVQIPSIVFMHAFPNLEHLVYQAANYSRPATGAMHSLQNSRPSVRTIHHVTLELLYMNPTTPAVEIEPALCVLLYVRPVVLCLVIRREPPVLLWQRIAELSPQLQYLTLKLYLRMDISDWLATILPLLAPLDVICIRVSHIEGEEQHQDKLRDTLAQRKVYAWWRIEGSGAERRMVEMSREDGDALWLVGGMSGEGIMKMLRDGTVEKLRGIVEKYTVGKIENVDILDIQDKASEISPEKLPQDYSLMKSSDIEKRVFLDVEEQPPARGRFPRLRALIVCGAIYAVFYLTVSSFVKHPRHTSYHHHHSKSWALQAFGHGTSEKLAGEKAEQVFLSTPNAESAIVASRAYATHPHLAGASEDLDDAKDILALFQKQFGITPPDELPIFPAGTDASRSATLGVNKLTAPTAWIDVYYPVMNTPLDRSLEILDANGETGWAADLVEDGDPADPEAAEYKDAVPTFHGLSFNGEAEGELVYANYGRKEDYDALLATGIDLNDKIILARYGFNFRGLKIKGAQELGAAAVLIYSDPRDDGSVTVENGYEPYPYGPARNPTSVQRGSVQFISVYPGDPTTPGYPAYENATRTGGESIPKIPSLPISWANAQRLLQEIDAEGDARLITGKTSNSTIRLVNHVDDKVTPIWNTMAVIPGHIKNETVLIGCHRDAWVMGAVDPVSGTVSLHEVIRGFGALLQGGWKPLRNVVFASWDAEEYGLIGSTEWAEDFADWITDNVVAYLNVDVSVGGAEWGVRGSPSLAHLVRRTALDVPHPTVEGKTLWDAMYDTGPFTGPADEEFVALYEAARRSRVSDTGVPPLGSGSDFTPLLQHLGIASVDQGFAPTPSDAVYHYHSIYDSERWQELYGDPGFHRHVAVAKHLGLSALRIADAIVLPLNTTQYALELDDYLAEVENIATSLAVSPDFSGLKHSISALQTASKALDLEKADAEKKLRELLDKLVHRRACSGHASTGLGWLKKILHKIRRLIHRHRSPIHAIHAAALRVQRANAKLVAFEQGFIDEEGIKDREWYRHLGVAPGKWLGYGATTLPAVSEALTIDHNATLAELEASRLAGLLDKLSEKITVKNARCSGKMM